MGDGVRNVATEWKMGVLGERERAAGILQWEQRCSKLQAGVKV